MMKFCNGIFKSFVIAILFSAPFFFGGYSSAAEEGVNSAAKDMKLGEWVKKSLKAKGAGKYDEAISYADRAIQSDPNDEEAYNARGMALYRKDQKGLSKKAIENYDKAIQLKPDFFEAYGNRGNAYGALGMYDKDIEDQGMALKLSPDYLLAYNGRAWAYTQKKMYDNAIADTTRSLELNKKNTDTYRQRGNAYHGSGKFDLAIQDYDQAITLEPDNADFYRLRSRSYLKKRDLDAAIADADRSLEMNPKEASTRFFRAEAYRGKNDFDRAIKDYTESLKLELMEIYVDEAYFGRGKAYQAKGLVNEALSDFRKAADLKPDNKEYAKELKELEKKTVVGKANSPQAVQASAGVNVLLMAAGYTEEWEGTKDRDSIQHQFKYIFFPATLEEIVEIVQKLGRKVKIKKLVFLGHGDPVGDVVDLGNGVGFGSGPIDAIANKLRKAGDSSVLDAFADNAEVIYLSCMAGVNPKLLVSTAQLFLAFSGGTVYGSETVVISDLTTGNTILTMLSNYLPFIAEGVNFTSPSRTDYHTFWNRTLAPFPHRNFKAQQQVVIKGPDSVNVNEKTVLEATISDQKAIPPEVRPFFKFSWQYDNKKKKKIGMKDRLVVHRKFDVGKIDMNTSAPTTWNVDAELFLDNGMGARKLGKAHHILFVEKQEDVAIDLFPKDFVRGQTLTARAYIRDGKVLKETMWVWKGEGGVRINKRKDDTIDFKVVGEGGLSAQLCSLGLFGKSKVLGVASIPIKPKPSSAADSPVTDNPPDKPEVKPSENSTDGAPRKDGVPVAVTDNKPSVAGGKEKPDEITVSPAPKKIIRPPAVTASETKEWGPYHLKYTISGAALVTPPEYKAPFGFDNYYYNGLLAGDTLTVSGTGWADNVCSDANYPYVLSVSVFSGDKKKTFEYKTPANEKLNKPFSLSVPVPAGVSSAGFSMTLVYHSGYGPRGIEVHGSLKEGEGIGSSGSGGVAQTATNPTPATNIVPLSVELSSSASTLLPDSIADVKATVSGGTPPYTIAWSGPHTGADTLVNFSQSDPGEYTLTASVTDSVSQQASKSILLTVEQLELTIRMDDTNGKKAILGIPVGFTATMKGQSAAKGALEYQWQPHPEAEFNPCQGPSPKTSVIFQRPGPTKVWVAALQSKDGALHTVAEAEQLEIDVVPPLFKLDVQPPSPLIGQEVKARIRVTPEVDSKYLDFRWLPLPANAQLLSESKDAREITFELQNGLPLKIEVLARTPGFGDDLGGIDGTITALPYTVQVRGPKLRGPEPKAWVTGKGLTDVPRGVTVHQTVSFRAEISPVPPNQPLTYQWSASSDACNIHNPISQDPNVTCSEAGSFNLTVDVKNARGVKLGTGSGALTVVPQAGGGGASNVEAAKAKLDEARAAAANGKLDEGIDLAGIALGLDPKNEEAKRLQAQWQNERLQMQQQLEQMRKAILGGNLQQAGTALAAARKLHSQYAPVVAAEAEYEKLKAEAVSAGERVNLALHKPANQSSIYGNNSATYGPQIGVDGNTNESLTAGFFHTDLENAPWWQVDLQNVRALKEVRLYNRTQTLSERARTLQVQLSTDGTGWETIYRHDGSIWTRLNIGADGKSARFVRVQLNEKNYLHLDEVEVYGVNSTTDDSDFSRQEAKPDSLVPNSKTPSAGASDTGIGSAVSSGLQNIKDAAAKGGDAVKGMADKYKAEQEKAEKEKASAAKIAEAAKIASASAVSGQWLKVEATPGLYSLALSGNTLVVAKQGNSPGGLQYAGMNMDLSGNPVTGDFEVQVGFRNARIDGGLNQVQLHAIFVDSFFLVVRDQFGSGSHVWAPGIQGDTPCGNSGTLRLERRGGKVTGYCDDRAIWSDTRKSPLQSLSFILQNNGTNDPISVTFHDWRFAAAKAEEEKAVSIGPEDRGVRIGSMEMDTDRAGADIRGLDLQTADPAACQAECVSTQECVAWTYIKPNTIRGPRPRCFLKHSVPVKSPNVSCISGVIERDSPRPVKQIADAAKAEKGKTDAAKKGLTDEDQKALREVADTLKEIFPPHK